LARSWGPKVLFFHSLRICISHVTDGQAQERTLIIPVVQLQWKLRKKKKVFVSLASTTSVNIFLYSSYRANEVRHPRTNACSFYFFLAGGGVRKSVLVLRPLWVHCTSTEWHIISHCWHCNQIFIKLPIIKLH
jgi:hypothetical protein